MAHAASDAIGAFLAKVGGSSKNSAKVSLKKLLSRGIVGGQIPELGLKLDDMATMTAILNAAVSTRFRGTEIMADAVHKCITMVETQDTGSWIDLMESVTRVGIRDSRLTYTCLARSLKCTESLSARDCVRLLNVIERQGVVHAEMVALLTDTLISKQPSPIDISRAFVALSNLGLPGARRLLQSTSIEGLDASIRVAWAILLDPKLTADAGIVQEKLLPTLTRIVVEAKKSVSSGALPPHTLRDLQFIRTGLMYSSSDVYSKVDPHVKDFLALHSALTDLAANPGRNDRTMPKFVGSVGSTLFRANIAHEYMTPVGPFTVDIKERDSKVVWLCNSESRYLSRDGQLYLRPYHALKEGILSGMGYTPVSIPFWHWTAMRNHKTRLDYCRTSRFYGMSQSLPATSCSGNPDSFDARAAAAVNLSGYKGEAFLQKSQSKKPWAWHVSAGLDKSTRIII